jgi:hypothetical protein
MIVSVEIITCLAAIAGCVKWTASEYTRVRKSRQMNQALQLAVSSYAS